MHLVRFCLSADSSPHVSRSTISASEGAAVAVWPAARRAVGGRLGAQLGAVQLRTLSLRAQLSKHCFDLLSKLGRLPFSPIFRLVKSC